MSRRDVRFWPIARGFAPHRSAFGAKADIAIRAARVQDLSASLLRRRTDPGRRYTGGSLDRWTCLRETAISRCFSCPTF